MRSAPWRPAAGFRGAYCNRKPVCRDIERRIERVRFEVTNNAARGIEILFPQQVEADAFSTDAQPPITDAGRATAQTVADGIDHPFAPLQQNRRNIDLQQQMRAALQVEPEIYLLVRQKTRERRSVFLAKEVGECRRDPQDANDCDQNDLPLSEINHARECFTG